MGYIGVDWGSSSFRAVLFDAEGSALDRIAEPFGVKSREPITFEDRFFARIARWKAFSGPAILSGMITSRDGWVESPYIPCPCDISNLILLAERRVVRGRELFFLPGLSQADPAADIMRGEEVQILAIQDGVGQRIAVLPGTHSKWALLDGRRVEHFRTIMTGELFDFLLNHSLAGSLAEGSADDDAVFRQAVRLGHDSASPVTNAFAARARTLLGQLSATATRSYLSGLLIGNEIREARQFLPIETRPVILLGEEGLCERYARALHHLGLPRAEVAPAGAERGFARLAAGVASLSLTR